MGVEVSHFGAVAAAQAPETPSGGPRLGAAALRLRLEDDAKTRFVSGNAAPRTKPSQVFNRDGPVGMQLRGGRREALRALDGELRATPVAPHRCALRRALAELPQHFAFTPPGRQRREVTSVQGAGDVPFVPLDTRQPLWPRMRRKRPDFLSFTCGRTRSRPRVRGSLPPGVWTPTHQ